MGFRTAITLAGAVALWAAAGGEASAQTTPQCGAPYQIQSGDTLSTIALQVYNDARRWRQIYEFAQNAQRIGTNPNRVGVGQVLDLPPCDLAAAGVAARPEAAAAVAARPQPVFPAAAPAQGAAGAAGFTPTIEIITGGGFRPFIDRDTEDGGFVAEIVRAAFRAAGLPNDTRVDFVNDWDSHVGILLRYNKYEFGFPWTQPDCSNPAALPEETRLRCEYVYSDPVYVVGIDVFGPKSLTPWPSGVEDLFDKRLCRPAGRTVDDLEAQGLRHARNITLMRAASTRDCFGMLERGEVDFVTDTRFTSELAINELGLSEFVTSYPALVNATPIHVIAHRDNAEASVLWMRAFNAGLASIRQSGEWDAIVNANVERFRASLR